MEEVRAARLDRIRAVARGRDYPADDERLTRLLAWLESLLAENQRVNLTGLRDLDEALGPLLLNALAVARAVTRPPTLVVDLGSGGGLPGVAAAVAWPQAEVWLVERRLRKARALGDLLVAVGIPNAQVVAVDGRDLLRTHPAVRSTIDLVTVRAVTDLAEAARIAGPWLAPGGRIAHWKGRGLCAAEEDAGRREAAAQGLQVLAPLAFADEAGPARLVCYERPLAPPRGRAEGRTRGPGRAADGGPEVDPGDRAPP